MDPNLILPPMGALAGLTFAVLLFVPALRMGRKPNVQDGADGDIPGALANPNFANLLEMPVLFYVICLMLFVTNRVDEMFVYLAWIYVVLRVLHSLIHLTYDNLRQRMALFALSNLVVIVMWVFFFVQPMMG
ncbi:MAG: MAPEG family protein [Rhizomicrobium sp.]